jgi:hypothetical protein
MNSIKPVRRGIRAHQDPKIKIASIDPLMIKDDYKMFSGANRQLRYNIS